VRQRVDIEGEADVLLGGVEDVLAAGDAGVVDEDCGGERFRSAIELKRSQGGKKERGSAPSPRLPVGSPTSFLISFATAARVAGEVISHL
jgi:hypothetical protein